MVERLPHILDDVEDALFAFRMVRYREWLRAKAHDNGESFEAYADADRVWQGFKKWRENG